MTLYKNHFSYWNYPPETRDTIPTYNNGQAYDCAFDQETVSKRPHIPCNR